MKLNFFVPLPELCTQLCNIFETYPITELENLFPVVIANIFGIDGARSWALRQNASDSSQEHVLYFLSPTGPLFALCNKLCTNQYLRFNFPCNYLSVSILYITNKLRYISFMFYLLYTFHAYVLCLNRRQCEASLMIGQMIYSIR